MTITSVGVLGGGVAGLAAAAKFIDLGYNVTLIDKKKIVSCIGGGLDVHPNGTKVLYSLGITEILNEVCSKNSREIRIADSKSKLLNCVPLNQIEVNPQYPMLSFFRSDILQVLFDNIKDRCTYYEETECTQITVQEDGVVLDFDKMASIRVDVLIAADGIHSLARKTFFPNSEKRYLGHMALGGRIPRELYQNNYIHGVRRTCVVFPCTEQEAHTLMFSDQPEEWLKTHRTFEEQRVAFEGWSEEVDRIIENIDPASRFCVACCEVPPLETYVFKRVFLAGDAAHAMSPLGALATAVALEDVDELGEQFADRTQTLEQIGANYDSKRIPRVKEFRDFSLQNLVPVITEHNEALYQKRMERFKTLASDQVFVPLIKLTQAGLENVGV